MNDVGEGGWSPAVTGTPRSSAPPAPTPSTLPDGTPIIQVADGGVFTGSRTVLDYNFGVSVDVTTTQILLFWDPFTLQITSWELDAVPEGLTVPQDSGCMISLSSPTTLDCERGVTDFTVSIMGSGNFYPRVRGVYENTTNEVVRLNVGNSVVEIPAMATVYTPWSAPIAVFYAEGGDLEINLDYDAPDEPVTRGYFPGFHNSVNVMLGELGLPTSATRGVVSALWILLSVGLLGIFVLSGNNLVGVAIGGGVGSLIWFGGPFIVGIPWPEIAACWGLLVGVGLITVYRKMR